MTKQTTLARIERLMHVPGNKYFIRATEALQAGRITNDNTICSWIMFGRVIQYRHRILTAPTTTNYV
jgi:hypothetical protein